MTQQSVRRSRRCRARTSLPVAAAARTLALGLTGTLALPATAIRCSIASASILRRGETLGLVGESGAGKSTIALVAIGLLRPPAVTLEGRMGFADRDDLLTQPEAAWAALRGRRIAMIFQDPASALNPCFTVGRQLTDPLRRLLGLDRRGGAAARDRAARERRAERRRGAARRLSARALRRHAAARDDRHRARLQSRAAACRRADQRARRHHPGPDHAADPATGAGAQRELHVRPARPGAGLAGAATASWCSMPGRSSRPAPTEIVLRRSLHPYTNALKSCVIELDTEVLTPPDGSLPGAWRHAAGVPVRAALLAGDGRVHEQGAAAARSGGTRRRMLASRMTRRRSHLPTARRREGLPDRPWRLGASAQGPGTPAGRSRRRAPDGAGRRQHRAGRGERIGQVDAAARAARPDGDKRRPGALPRRRHRDAGRRQAPLASSATWR